MLRQTRLVAALVSVAISAPILAQQTPSELNDRVAAARRAEVAARLARIDAERAQTVAELRALGSDVVPVAPLQAPPPALVAKAEQAAPAAGDVAPVKDPDPKKVVTEAPGTSGKFGGLEFGVGISYTNDLGNRDRIGSASVVNGIVRVDDENNGNARIMLESHYFFTPCGDLLRIRGLSRNPCEWQGATGWKRGEPKWGWGPFVALQPSGGDGKLIDAIAMGGMIGLRKSEKTTQSFNFGIGYVMDINVKVLGDGVVANQPLPAGETAVRLKDTSQSGLLLISSFSF